MGDLEDQVDSENPLEASFSRTVYDIDDDDLIRANLKDLTAQDISDRIEGVESMLDSFGNGSVRLQYDNNIHYVSAQQYIFIARKKLEKISGDASSQNTSL